MLQKPIFHLICALAVGFLLAISWQSFIQPLNVRAALPTCKNWVSSISGNTTWELADSPICIEPDLEVPAGITLTIQSSVIV